MTLVTSGCCYGFVARPLWIIPTRLRAAKLDGLVSTMKAADPEVNNSLAKFAPVVGWPYKLARQWMPGSLD
jgi:hypothetical protein